jgi:hypothetical protein
VSVAPEELLNLIPKGPRQAFICLSVATDEVERYEHVPRDLWMALHPPMGLVGRTEAMYRSHVRELLARAESCNDLDVITDAEILAGLSNASLKAPLNQPGALLYHHLFRTIFGEEVHDKILDGTPPPEPSWPMQLQELLHDAKRQRVSRIKRVPRVRLRKSQDNA